MSTQVQFRRGTTAETAAFIGAIGEVTVDTGKNTCVVHDAVTLGGYPLLRQDGVNSGLFPGSLTSCALKFANSANTGIISPAPGAIALVNNGVAGFTMDSSGAISIPGNVSITGSLTVSGSFNSSDNLALIVALG
jgi:hypothetical protein